MIEKLPDIALEKLKPTAAKAKTPLRGNKEVVDNSTRTTGHIPAAEARKVFEREYENGGSFQDLEAAKEGGIRPEKSGSSPRPFAAQRMIMTPR